MKKERGTLIAFIAIVILGLFMRIFLLDLKPMHHDEGNLWYHFISNIINGKDITYFIFSHGFTPFYLTSIPVYFFGDSLFVLRLTNVVFGTLTIIALWPLKRYMGHIGLLTAAAFIAVSPSLVYFTRFSATPYPYFTFFEIITVILFIQYTKKYESKYLYGIAASLALLLTVHEITLLIVTLAASFFFVVYVFDGHRAKHITENLKKISKKHLVLSILLFVFIIIFIMSSFFTNIENLSNLTIRTYEEVGSAGQNKPMDYYFKTQFVIEIFAFLGSALYLFFLKRDNFSNFVFYITVAIFGFLTIIPYKIVWTFNVALLPMYLLAGLCIENIFEKLKHKHMQNIVLFVVVLLFLFTFHTSLKLNFITPIDRMEDNPLNYVGPVENNQELIDMLGYLTQEEGKQVLLTIGGGYPLPYYLQNSQNWYLDDKNIDLTTQEEFYDIFITDSQTTYEGNNLTEIGTYELREGHFVKIFEKNK